MPAQYHNFKGQIFENLSRNVIYILQNYLFQGKIAFKMYWNAKTTQARDILDQNCSNDSKHLETVYHFGSLNMCYHTVICYMYEPILYSYHYLAYTNLISSSKIIQNDIFVVFE